MSERHIALIRCDASMRIGYGHLIRCMALADQMQASGKWEVIFAMAEDIVGVERARAHGFIVECQDERPEDHAEGDWLSLLVERHQSDVLVLDVRSKLRPVDVERIRNDGVLIVCIDDLSERRLSADLVFYPPIPQVTQLDWTNFHGECHCGWDWIMMPVQFAMEKASHPVRKANDEVLRLMVTMGGSDPAGLTLLAVDALNEMDETFEVCIVTGSVFMHEAALTCRLQQAKRTFTVLKNPPSIAAVMGESDLALASFGATAYELACLSVPAVHLCLSTDHVKSASALHEAGAAISLGEYTSVSKEKIQKTLRMLLKDADARAHMSKCATALIDGRGVKRISDLLDNFIEVRHATCN